jgi:hypothetical protein
LWIFRKLVGCIIDTNASLREQAALLGRSRPRHAVRLLCLSR